MKNTVVEMFLSEYFLVKAITDVSSDDDKKLFYGLGKIYMVPAPTLDGLYPVVCSESVCSVSSEKDFMQYSRIKKYVRLMGGSRDDGADEILSIKGGALALAAKLNLKADDMTPRNTQFNNIAKSAGVGEINSLRISGILQCEGVYFDMNEKAGLKCLLKSADWNDAGSVLALLRYCPDTREYNLSRLNMIVRDTPFYGLYVCASEFYGLSYTEEIEEVKLLEKAFSMSVVKREAYDPKYARIIYCKALKIREKEKVIFSRNNELVSAVADLPLKLSGEGAVYTDAGTLFKSVPLMREVERDKILRNLLSAGLRRLNSYRPLCIYSRSGFLLNMYADAIRRADGIHAERVDVSDLTEYDFEPSMNNIFLRGVDEDRDNYCLLFMRGDIPERALSAVKNFLQSAKRGRFHINNPCITIDLRSVLPVCFADPENASKLKPYCDVVELADVIDGEKRAAVRSMVELRKRLYRTKSVTLADEVYSIFENMDIDRIETMLDGAMRSHKTKGGVMKLTSADFMPFMQEGKISTIGFGGAGI